MSWEKLADTGFPIDFVIPWVDGTDPEWQKEKAQYQGLDLSAADDRASRYRDWGMLKFWFRGVEKFAPWVHRIYFVTCGHVPDWMNPNAPKLVHVKHVDYMPQEYLPTFSSHPIELNLHRIEDLSEHFVYFNDDLFLLKPVEPEFFFKSGLPVFSNEMQPVIARPGSVAMANIYINDISIINNHFNPNETLKDKQRWYSFRTHGKKAALFNLFFARYFSRHGFIGFRNPHFAVPTLKSTMNLVWREEADILDATSRRKFRDSRDVNQYLFRYWHFATNQFIPEKTGNLGKFFEITEDTEPICKAIREQLYPQIVLNDNDQLYSDLPLQKAQEEICSAFESILPEKCIYEK